MSKTFITERDVDEMKTRGINSIEANDNVVITDLAAERAMRYGIRIHRVEQAPPRATYSPSVNLAVSSVHTMASRSSDERDLKDKIKAAVIARLDGQVDAALLDAVITRVVSAMK